MSASNDVEVIDLDDTDVSPEETDLSPSQDLAEVLRPTMRSGWNDEAEEDKMNHDFEALAQITGAFENDPSQVPEPSEGDDARVKRQKTLPPEYEIIDLISDTEIENLANMQPTDYVENVDDVVDQVINGDQNEQFNGDNKTNDQPDEVIDNLEALLAGDDDIEILGTNVVQPSEEPEQGKVQSFNQPAPVPHWGDDKSLELAQQMRQQQIVKEKRALAKEVIKISTSMRECAKEYREKSLLVEQLKRAATSSERQGNPSLGFQYKQRSQQVSQLLSGILSRYNALKAPEAEAKKRYHQFISSHWNDANYRAAAAYDEPFAEYWQRVREEDSQLNQYQQEDQEYEKSEYDYQNYQASYNNVYMMGRPDHSKELQDLLNNIRPDEEIEQEGHSKTPPGLTVSLLKHQRMGLSWLQRMESSNNKGGILADDMGLGKTVQAISLMLTNRSEDRKHATNLIVAPVALLKQWQAEVETKVIGKAGLSTFLFHQGVKLRSFREMRKYDVVLTSYGTLASEMKKHYKKALKDSGLPKTSSIIPDVDSGGDAGYVSPFYDKEAIFYRVILDEAQWIKNKSTQTSKSVALLKGTYRWCLSGTPMQNNIEELFPMIRFLQINPYQNEQKFRMDIVLPLKNQASDKYDRYDGNRAMKKIQVLLKAILLRRTKDSEIDGKPILSLPPKIINLDHVVMNNDELTFYQDLEGKTAKKAERMLNEKKQVGTYSNILTLLLRLRQTCCHNYLVKVSNEDETEETVDWRKQLAHLQKLPQQAIKRATDDCVNGFNCPVCFDVPTPDKVSVLNPCGHGLCTECVSSFFEDNQLNNEAEGHRVAKCTICQLQCAEDRVVEFQILDLINNKGLSTEDVERLYTQHKDVRKDRKRKMFRLIQKEGGTFTSSAKIDKAIDIIENVYKKPGNEKIIIFSQFTSLFDIFQLALDKTNISWLRYDGSMSANLRNDTISRFYREPEKRVLLLSLKAGNVGLTLTCANHVIIMDPFWNPYVEEQAMDRAHRIGQQRKVQVHRILIKNTVEDRIMTLQDKKRQMVEGALDPAGMKDVSRLGKRELGFLFGLNSLDD